MTKSSTYPWTDLRLEQAAEAAARGDCDCAGCVDVISLAAEVHSLRYDLAAANEREARLREALAASQEAVALLNSMVLCGEDHSDRSRAAVDRAMGRGQDAVPEATAERSAATGEVSE